MALLDTRYDRFQEPRDTPRGGPESFTYREDELFLHRCVVVFGLTFDVFREAGEFAIEHITLDGKPLDESDGTGLGIGDAIRAHYATPHGQVTLYEAYREETDE